MKKRTSRIVLSLFLAASMFGTMGAPKSVMAAEAPINMGTAEDFAILSGETITNTGSTEITGDVGLYPGTDFTGEEDVTLTGVTHLNDPVASTAKDDLKTAYNDAAGRTPQIISSELGGQILTPGVYTSEEKVFQLTGKLTLDGEGDPNALFIFQTGTTLITAPASSVEFTGAATACNVFWQVGSSATIGTGSEFAGTILALTSISLQTGAQVRGQLLARNGSVTLDTNKIISGPCVVTDESDQMATLTIIKMVVNEDDETAVAGDFNIRVLKDGLDVEGSPSIGMDTPGTPYTLEAGDYMVTEEAEEGYLASYSGDSVDGTITLEPGDEKTVIITNTKVNGSVELTKSDENGNPLSGAEFTLYKDDVEVGEPKSTDENGIITFSGLTDGSYTLKETNAPEGYVLSDAIEEIEITDGNEMIEISFTNTRIMGTVNIKKVDAETGAVLAGAGFIITGNTGAEVFNGKTDEKGMISIDLPYGDYVIEEVTAPDGFVKSDKKYSVDITENEQVFDLVVENVMVQEKGPILPMAGDTTGTIFLFMGALAISGGLLLMRKKQTV